MPSLTPFCTYTPSIFSTHPPTTKLYTLSLHDALPIFAALANGPKRQRFSAPLHPIGEPRRRLGSRQLRRAMTGAAPSRSEEHSSELQSPCNLVCRLLLEKKNTENQKHKWDNNYKNAAI